MSTSDRTPTGNLPADDQRLDRLYKAMHNHANNNESTSPADLDDVIRAAAKAPQSSDQAGFWRWQQRAGWATAAAVVLTSALLISQPETKSLLTTEAPNNGLRTAPRTAPATSADDADENSPSQSATTQQTEVAGAQPTTSQASAPAIKPSQLPTATPLPTSQPALTAKPKSASSADQTVVEMSSADTLADTSSNQISERSRTMRNVAAMKSAKTLRQDSQPDDRETSPQLEEIVVTGSYRNSSCQAVDSGEPGLIKTICGVPGRKRSYVLHPNDESKCKALRLDRQRTRPAAEPESNAEQFVYTVGKRKYSATCQRGSWVVQPFARGR